MFGPNFEPPLRASIGGDQAHAIDAATGSELWRTKLKGADFVTVGNDDERVYAATKGELFALEPHTGTIVWGNKLKGLGLGLTAVLTNAGASDLSGAAKRLADQQAQAAIG